MARYGVQIGEYQILNSSAQRHPQAQELAGYVELHSAYYYKPLIQGLATQGSGRIVEGQL